MMAFRDGVRVYRWKVVLRQEVQGFQRSFDVAAINAREAETAAFRELTAGGKYDEGDFILIELKRGAFA